MSNRRVYCQIEELPTASRLYLHAYYRRIPSTESSPQDLPELTYSEPTSPSDIDGLCLDWPVDRPETEPKTCEISSPDDDALFAQSPSPPPSHAKRFGDDNHGSTKAVFPPEVCLIMDDSCSADLTNYNGVKPEEEVTKVKPRITLRIKPPLESKPKPKITLRLGS